jgi:hypothetical protein
MLAVVVLGIAVMITIRKKRLKSLNTQSGKKVVKKEPKRKKKRRK